MGPLVWLACQPLVELSPPTRTDPPDPTQAGCVPDEAAFVANAQPILESACGTCHGANPQFGAPYGLLDYAALVDGDVGLRRVDQMVTVLLDGSMPPANTDPLTHGELDTLVSWGSCGELHPDPTGQLQASQPVFTAPDTPPEDAVVVDITADSEPISPTTIDDYRVFRFSNLVEEDQFIRRIEPLVDETRVVHHITVRRSSTGRYLYTWAPGTSPIQFPDGGLRITPRDTLEIEIHYNNGAGIPDVTDSSGMRLWLADPADTEWGMVDPQSWRIGVPPNSTSETVATCEAQSDFVVLAGMPHMHEVGSSFRQTLIREDGTQATMIELTGWSFEAQYFYEMPFAVQRGDIIEIVCGYDNQTDDFVGAGLGTSDEMCFDFMYVTPANARLDCPLF